MLTASHRVIRTGCRGQQHFVMFRNADDVQNFVWHCPFQRYGRACRQRISETVKDAWRHVTFRQAGVTFCFWDKTRRKVSCNTFTSYAIHLIDVPYPRGYPMS
jgi:hypothetical protein